MTLANFYRVGAVSAMLGGVFILLQRLFFDVALAGALVRPGTLVPQLGLLAVLALYLRDRETLGRLGAWGFFLHFLGLAYLGCIDFGKHYILEQIDPVVSSELLSGPVRIVFLSLAMVFLLGTLLFGIAMVLRSSRSRVAVVLYTVGFGAFALSAFLPIWLATMFQMIGAAGAIMLGQSLWVGSPTTDPATR